MFFNTLAIIIKHLKKKNQEKRSDPEEAKKSGTDKRAQRSRPIKASFVSISFNLS